MKKISVVLIVGLLLSLSINAFGQHRAPIEPWISKIQGQVQFNGIGNSVVGADSTYDDDGTLFYRIKRATYDVAVDGGAAGSYDLGIKLPAGSKIENSIIYVETAFTASPGTVATDITQQIYCEDQNNILSGANLTEPKNTAGVLLAAASSETLVSGIASECTVYAAHTGSSYLTGKYTIHIKYFQ